MEKLLEIRKWAKGYTEFELQVTAEAFKNLKDSVKRVTEENPNSNTKPEALVYRISSLIVEKLEALKVDQGKETKGIQQAMRDWQKEYGETPWSAEAKEIFKLLKGSAKAIGLSDEEFEKLWIAETRVDLVLEDVRFMGFNDKEEIVAVRPLVCGELRTFHEIISDLLLDTDRGVSLLAEFAEEATDGKACTIGWEFKDAEVGEILKTNC